MENTKIIYAVYAAPDRIKFGLTKDGKSLKSRLKAYSTIVPDSYLMKAWEVVDHKYVESNIKKRFNGCIMERGNTGRKTEVIKVPTNSSRDFIIQQIDDLVFRSNQGF